MHHRKIIERLGGYAAVAEKLGRDPSTVWKWQVNGIPPSAWPAIAEMAREQGIQRAGIQALQRTSPLYGKVA